MPTTTQSSHEYSVQDWADRKAHQLVQDMDRQGRSMQTGQRTRDVGGQQQPATDERAWWNKALKFAVDKVAPVLVEQGLALLQNQRSAYGVEQTRDTDAMQREIADLYGQLFTSAITAVDDYVERPPQRSADTEATRWLGAVLSIGGPLIAKGAKWVIDKVGNQRGPLSLDNDQDRILLGQYFTQCFKQISTNPEIFQAYKELAQRGQQQPQEPDNGGQQPGDDGW